MASVTWTCPNCSRRVPNRVSTCHCGTTRAQAEQLAIVSPARGAARFGRPAAAEPGWDVKGLAIALVLVAVVAVAWLFRPHRPDPIFPVLGFADRAPTPSPSPKAPRRRAPPPAFKLPWWK